MAFFNKKSDTEEVKKAPRNPNNVIMFRLLAIGYVGYLLANMIKLYIEGGPEAPSLTVLIIGIAVLGGGCLYLAFISYREWKTSKVAYEQYMAELRGEAEARRAAEEAAEAEDEEEYDDDLLLEEAEDDETEG